MANNEPLLRALKAQFQLVHEGTPDIITFAPGRINLIGEHIDYCGGTVLPMTIQQGTYVAVRATQSGRLRAASANRSGRVDIPLPSKIDALEEKHWGRYLLGACLELAERGFAFTGLDVVVQGDLPGSGLSSSASLTIAFSLAATSAMRQLLPGGRYALAELAQKVEHKYLNVNCGIMDQIVIAQSEAGKALALDCFNLTLEHLPIPNDPVFVVIDSLKPRHLGDAPYNERQEQVKKHAADLCKRLNVRHLCEIPTGKLAEVENSLDSLSCKRIRHVILEQARVRNAIRALKNKDWRSFGNAMTASHLSLRDDFEVSCKELDVLVDAARIIDGVYGARLTGAGFGGSVIALVEADQATYCIERVTSAYEQVFNLKPKCFIASPSGAVRLLDR